MDFTLLSVLFSLIGIALAYPSGAPTDACSNLLPNHGADPSKTASPFTISVSQQTYSPGTPITVTITTSDEQNSPISGFLLQARSSGGNTPVGTFSNPPQYTKLLTCSNSGDSITHSSSERKGSTVQFTWNPPTNNVGNVVISGTVVASKLVYFGVLNSDSMSYSQGMTSTPGNYGVRPSSNNIMAAILVFVACILSTLFLK